VIKNGRRREKSIYKVYTKKSIYKNVLDREKSIYKGTMIYETREGTKPHGMSRELRVLYMAEKKKE